MRRIPVDEQVYAALAALATDPFTDTPNRVLRRLLHLTDTGPDPATSRTNIPPHLAPLLAAGLLAPGQQLTWNRPRLRTRHTATVTADGRLRLDDGTIHPSPYQAARHLAGHPANGYTAFTTADGITLAQLAAALTNPDTPPTPDPTSPDAQGA